LPALPSYRIERLRIGYKDPDDVLIIAKDRLVEQRSPQLKSCTAALRPAICEGTGIAEGVIMKIGTAGVLAYWISSDR
jgi:hypothetical protein